MNRLAKVPFVNFNEKFYTPVMGYKAHELNGIARTQFLDPALSEQLGSTDYESLIFPDPSKYDYVPAQLRTLEHVMHYYTCEYPGLPDWLIEPLARKAIGKDMNRNERRAYRRKWVKELGAEGMGLDPGSDDENKG